MMSELQDLKNNRDEAIELAEKLAYKYFAALDVGPGRSMAHDVYHNLHNSKRLM